MSETTANYTVEVLVQVDTAVHNLTDKNNLSYELTEPYAETYWLISEIVLTTLTLFSIYLLLCRAKYPLNSNRRPGRQQNSRKRKLLYWYVINNY